MPLAGTLWRAFFLVVVASCSSSPGTQGNSTSAGSSAGGSAAGGASSSGGNIAAGGVLSTGGATATNASSTAGGTPSSGGSIAAGGIVSTGGTTATNTSSTAGGAPSSGGSIAAGGIVSTGGTTATNTSSTAGGTPSSGSGIDGGDDAGASVCDTYLATGPWKGCVWTQAQESTHSEIIPYTVSSKPGSYCAEGTAEPNPTSYDTWAAMGFNLNQEARSNQVGTWNPVGTTGLVVRVTRRASFPLRLYLDDASGKRWCRDLPGTEPSTTPKEYSYSWQDFTTECWNTLAPGTAYAKEPITAVTLLVPGNMQSRVYFDFCLDAIAVEPRTSGLPSTKRLADLTSAEFGLLCDWTANLFGGYGQTIDCGSSLGRFGFAPYNQAECLNKLVFPSNCATTVANWENCFNAHSHCDSSQCAPVDECFT
jgi:hypothetical protein